MGKVVGGGMDRAILSADHAPATFSLHSPQCRQHARPQPAESGTVRYLVETVLGCYRADFHRLKQQVIAFVAQNPTAPDTCVGQGECGQGYKTGG